MCLPDVLARFLPFPSIGKVPSNVWTFFSQPSVGQGRRDRMPIVNLLEIHEIVLGEMQFGDTQTGWALVDGLRDHR